MKLYYFVSWGGNGGPDTVWLVRGGDIEKALLAYEANVVDSPGIDVIYEIGLDSGVSDQDMVLAGPFKIQAINQGWASWNFIEDKGWVKN